MKITKKLKYSTIAKVEHILISSTRKCSLQGHFLAKAPQRSPGKGVNPQDGGGDFFSSLKHT